MRSMVTRPRSSWPHFPPSSVTDPLNPQNRPQQVELARPIPFTDGLMGVPNTISQLPETAFPRGGEAYWQEMPKLQKSWKGPLCRSCCPKSNLREYYQKYTPVHSSRPWKMIKLYSVIVAKAHQYMVHSWPIFNYRGESYTFPSRTNY